MELKFEYSKKIGTGVNPSLIHKSNGDMVLFWLEGSTMLEDTISAKDLDFSTLNFGMGKSSVSDASVEKLRIKNMPRVGIFGVWERTKEKNKGKEQRFGIYESTSDVTEYLENGNTSLDINNPIASISLTLNNSDGKIAGEEKTWIEPGMKITSLFTMGDSEEYKMGTFYVDRAEFDVGGNLKVDGRNVTGKMLNDQHFSHNLDFKIGTLNNVIKQVLDDANVEDYRIQESAISLNVSFKPESTILQGLKELLKLEPTWDIAEDANGTIIIGNPDEFFYFRSMYSNFVVERDELISRKITMDDRDVYSRIIVYCITNEVTVSKSAEVIHVYDWQNIPNKTKFLELPEFSSEKLLQNTANMLAKKYSKTGVINSLVKPFTPYIIPRDSIEIIQKGKRSDLGLITDVTHDFGRSGFITKFTTDGAGLKGEDTIISLLEKEEPNANIKIL